MSKRYCFIYESARAALIIKQHAIPSTYMWSAPRTMVNAPTEFAYIIYGVEMWFQWARAWFFWDAIRRLCACVNGGETGWLRVNWGVTFFYNRCVAQCVSGKRKIIARLQKVYTIYLKTYFVTNLQKNTCYIKVSAIWVYISYYVMYFYINWFVEYCYFFQCFAFVYSYIRFVFW